MGSWNFTATEYDSTCTGDGEIVAEGTMIFNETDVVITNNISFNSFCSDFNGTLVDDTTCVLGGYYGNDTLTLSFMHGYCQSAGMILTNTGCSQTSTNSYTFLIGRIFKILSAIALDRLSSLYLNMMSAMSFFELTFKRSFALYF